LIFVRYGLGDIHAFRAMANGGIASRHSRVRLRFDRSGKAIDWPAEMKTDTVAGSAKPS
jgi:hypothetical protein